VAISGLLLLAFLAACANPGPPRPPSLHLPQTVKDLSAQRSGNEVVLRWTTPARTTDGLDIKGSVSAELCREDSPPACTPVARLPVKPAQPGQYTDTLPAALAAGPPSLIAYRVRILNGAGRSAAASSAVYAAAGTAPPPVAGLRATASRSGITLEWQPENVPDAWVELDRVRVSSPTQTAKPQAAKANPLAAEPTAEVRLVRLKTPQQRESADPGGVFDRTAERAATYTYQAQRVRTVTLAGRALELRGEPSPVITVPFADTFPTEPPAALVSVPGEDGSISLSWSPVLDPGLAGYHVYRRPADSSQPFQRLTESPVTTPAFTDTTAARGQRYVYRVTAIDTSGNESQPSNEVTEIATP